ncbi:MAG: proton-conducting transporter membrane subunit [Candidatus Paceibacterota bacterium]|jgi:hydrogenase-4 component F
MLLILLILIPLIAALSSCATNKPRALEAITVTSAVLGFIIWALIAKEVLAAGRYSYLPFFSVDALGLIVLFTVALIGAAAACYSVGYIRAEVEKGIIKTRVQEYYILVNLFLLAMFFAITTVSPILMWIAIEATTLSTAFLVSFYNKQSTIEAAWKYLLINSVGLLISFFGTLLFLTAVSHTSNVGFLDWQTLLANAGNLEPLIAKIAFIFILVGFGTKVGFAPMHTWKPDAYTKTPTPVTALFSGSLLNVALLAIIRFKVVTDTALGVAFSQNLLIFFGLFSIIIAAFIMLVQKNYKRLFAYSSIEHAGIMALGLGFGGIAAPAAILHMVYHSIAKSMLFFTSGNIFLKYSSTKIAKVKGVLTALPITGVMLIIGFLAIAGVPPFGIFITEFYILSSGITAHPVLVTIALAALALVFVGLLRHIVSLSFSKTDEGTSTGEFSLWTTIPPLVLLVLLIILSLYLPLPLRLLLNAVDTSI